MADKESSCYAYKIKVKIADLSHHHQQSGTKAADLIV